MMKRLILSFLAFTLISFPFEIIKAQYSSNYSDSLIQLIEISKDSEVQAGLHMKLCWILRNKDTEKALFHGNSALGIINQNKLDEKHSEALNFLGVVHKNKGEYAYALDLFNQALEWAMKTENKIQQAYSYNNIGGIYTLTNSYPEAIEAIEKAKKGFEEIGQIEGIGYASVNLGNLYRHLKSFEISLNYLNEAERIKTQINDSIGLTVVKQLKAEIFKEKGNSSKANELFLELKSAYLHNHDLKGQAYVYNELGGIEKDIGNNTKAIQLFLEAEKLNQDLQNKPALAYNAINLGSAYLNLNLFQNAINHAQEGYQLGMSLGDNRILLNANLVLSEIYQKQGNWKASLDANKEYLSIYKRLNNHELNQQVNSVRDKYINEKRIIEQILLEEKNQKLEQESKFSRTKFKILLIGAILAFTFIILLVILLYSLRKKNEEAKLNLGLLNTQNNKLLESNTTKEKFLSIIGHDLKNPFNSVLGLSDLIIDQWKSLDNEERFQISNEINSSSHHLYELLDNLLIWSRTQTNIIEKKPEIFDLNEVVKEIALIFQNQATFKNINVRLKYTGVKKVYADPNMISTVIRNLLSNALKFTQDGGQIEIRIQQKSDFVEFSISDNGKGILPDNLKRIFEDKGHQSTKGTANETGSGLGLLLAKDFIQRNKGIIWVESKPGKGSLFTFTLPAS